MAAFTIFALLIISIVFMIDFTRAILEIRRDRAALRAQWRRTKAGGFSV